MSSDEESDESGESQDPEVETADAEASEANAADSDAAEASEASAADSDAADAPGDSPQQSAEELAPAVYEASDVDAKGFAPQLPWRLLGVGAVVIVSVIGGYLYNEEVETSALRESIVQEYATGVEPDARLLRGFRQRLEELVIASAENPPETHADPRLRFAAMHDAHGVYLRIRAADAGSSEAIAHGSSRMMPDAFTRCLGIAPTSLRGLFERGAFLDTTWPERLRDAHTRLRLRVIQDELRRHISRDLPLFTELLDADYFLLVLEQEDGAFDVFMWDLHDGTELLRTRARPSGLLVPVRINLPGIPNGPRPHPMPHPVGAAECSIAGHVKALTHEDTMTFGSHMPEPTPPSAADAGTADAAVVNTQAGGTAITDVGAADTSTTPTAPAQPSP